MKIEKVDYRSDFTLKICVKDILKAPLTLSSYDFDGVITSDESNKSYAFSRKDGKCSENCLVDNSDDSLIIVKFYDFDLSPGRLVLTFTLYVIDETFPNGIRKDVAQCRLNVKLTDGKCPIEYSIEDVELVLPTIKGQKGDKGDKGDQGLQGVQGAQGERGLKGDKGDAFTYDDFTPEQLAALKGPKGDPGTPGAKGDKGDKGDTGTIESNTGAEINGDCSVSGTVSTAKMQLDGVDVNTLIVREFHGIRNSIPDGLIATSEKVSVKPVEGAAYDIIYIRTLKRFVALAEGSYSDRFIGEEYYNVITNDKPTKAREDRVWRWENDLYKLDPKGCIKAHYGYSNNKDAWINEYTPDLVCLTDNGLTEFVAKWREAICYSMMSSSSVVGYYGGTDVYGNQIAHEDYGGYYPDWAAVEGKTPGFYINGIFGISYDEARLIYEYRTCGSYPRKILECGGAKLRTNLLCNYNYYLGGGQNGQGINTPMVFSSDGIKVVRVAAGVRGQRPPALRDMMMYGTAWLRGMLSFNSNQYLEEVIGGVQVDAESILLISNGFYRLKYLWIFNLNISLALTFKNASDLDIDCLRYLVEYSRATAAKPISVTLHPDLFARLTDDILELAETKYVTFVSA